LGRAERARRLCPVCKGRKVQLVHSHLRPIFAGGAGRCAAACTLIIPLVQRRQLSMGQTRFGGRRCHGRAGACAR
jgi:hypothetical protein